MIILDLNKLPLYWEMVNAEKIALLNLLNDIKPIISIEIGTREGGSLQLVSELSETVYSLDIDPSVKKLTQRFPNVNFIIGDSNQTLPALLNDLHSKNEQPDFILIDGDHSAEGVKRDIENILQLKITRPVTILMHDSFNPSCRKGMLEADYTTNAHIERVEIDFVQGIFSPSAATKGEMWGGFGLIHLNPATSNDNPVIEQTNAYSYHRTFVLSKHYHSTQCSFLGRLKSYLFRKLYT